MKLGIPDRLDTVACKVAVFSHIFGAARASDFEFSDDEIAGLFYLASEIRQEIRQISGEMSGRKGETDEDSEAAS